MVGQAGALADLPSCVAAHTLNEIRCTHTQRGPSSRPFSAARQTPPRAQSFQTRTDCC